MLRSGFSCFGICIEIAEHLIILEWTKLVCTPAPGSLFVSPDVGKGWKGRGGEWRGGEGRGGEGREGGRERGGRRGMTVIHILLAPQYLNTNHVKYYVIT